MKLKDKDLPKLKHLLKELRNSDSVYPETLNDFFDKKDVENEFKRLGGILNSLNLCNTNVTKIGAVVLLPNPNTFNFDFDQYVKEYNEEEFKENLEFKKTQTDLELAEKMLKEFPNTKRNARISIWIAGVLLFVQLAEWIISLLSP